MNIRPILLLRPLIILCLVAGAFACVLLGSGVRSEPDAHHRPSQWQGGPDFSINAKIGSAGGAGSVRKSLVDPKPSGSVTSSRREESRQGPVSRITAERYARLRAAMNAHAPSHADLGAPSNEQGENSLHRRGSRRTSTDKHAEAIATLNDSVPLFRECYANTRDPNLGDDARFSFTWRGEPEVGLLFTDVQVLDGSLAQNPKFVECMNATIETLEFSAPAEGVEISMNIELQFDDDETDTLPAKEANNG